MDVRERLAAVWAGQTPDVIPFTIYEWLWGEVQNDTAWPPLYQSGLGVTFHTNTTYSRSETSVERLETTYQEQGHSVHRTTLRTPVGEAHEVAVDGWRTKYLLETPEDYRVLTYCARHTEVLPCYENYAKVDRGPRWQVPLVFPGRSPFQQIHVDSAGLENISLHLFEMPDAVEELFDALMPSFRRTVELVAAGPGRFVVFLENYTAEMGPDPYQRFLAPVYQELFPGLRRAGKVVGVHYDGRLAAVQDLVAQQPFDLLESLTPPPEGDLTLAACRRAWPHLQFWHNLNVTQYQLPPSDLTALVQRTRREASVEDRLLALECSEERPANWRQSFPIVLQALAQAGQG